MFGALPPDKALVKGTVDEFDRAVGADVEGCRSVTDAQVPGWRGFDGQQELMLLRLDTGCTGGLIGEVQELADGRAQAIETEEVTFVDSISCHDNIVSRCIS